MAKTYAPPYVQSIRNEAIELDSADTTSTVSLCAAGTEGSVVSALSVTSDDTSDRYMKVFLYDGSNDYQIGYVDIPAGAGTSTGVPAVDLLNSVDMPWLPDDEKIMLENGWSIRVAMAVAITAAKVVHVSATLGDY